MRLSDSQTEMGCLIVMGSAWGEWQSRQYFTCMHLRGKLRFSYWQLGF